MNATRKLKDLGQSLWLDNITRGMLHDGSLRRYIDELSVTGLTSNPTIFLHAMEKGELYDDAISRMTADGLSVEEIFFELALDDLRQAADLFLTVHDTTSAMDGWVSLELSPVLANDTAGSIRAAIELHRKAQRPNLFIKIPGTPEGVPAIEESIFRGVPINVTLLFSAEQYTAAANAYLRGIERRIAAGLDPRVHSVASLFVSRWDVAVQDAVPPALRNRLGIAVARHAYREYRRLLASPRWQSLAAAGTSAQQLLWASTGTKDPSASDTMYVEALAAPNTIDTIPDKTLLAFAEHGTITGVMPVDGGDFATVLAEFARVGIDVSALAAQLQHEGTASFGKSWKELLDRLSNKSVMLLQRGRTPTAPEAGAR
ncbi:MAG: transaldolase [Gemmatimonadaceae bacterium]|nr:transaldolase [Gemmatimonadaceae bacterium]